MVHNKSLTDDDIFELKEAFALFDTNGDGIIDHEELRQALSDMMGGQDPSNEEVTQMAKSVDVNGDGNIDFEEFVLYMKPRLSRPIPEEELERAFKTFDTDGSGSIDRKEWKQLMRKLGQPTSKKELDAIMDKADITGNGKIEYAEFKVMMLF